MVLVVMTTSLTSLRMQTSCGYLVTSSSDRGAMAVVGVGVERKAAMEAGGTEGGGDDGGGWKRGGGEVPKDGIEDGDGVPGSGNGEADVSEGGGVNQGWWKSPVLTRRSEGSQGLRHGTHMKCEVSAQEGWRGLHVAQVNARLSVAGGYQVLCNRRSQMACGKHREEEVAALQRLTGWR